MLNDQINNILVIILTVKMYDFIVCKYMSAPLYFKTNGWYI